MGYDVFVTFWQALNELLFGAGQISGYSGPALLLFALACTCMAAIAVLLDRVIYEVRGKSVLDLAYGPQIMSTVRLLLLWSVGAGLGGFLGAAFAVFQMTRSGAITVGVGWPLILPRLVASLAKDEDEQEPEQN